MTNLQIPHTFIPKETIETFIPCLGSEQQFFTEIGIKLGGYSELTKGYSIFRKKPGFHILSVLLEGEMFCTLKGKRYTIGQGTIMLFDQYSQYNYWVDTDSKLVWFHLNPNFWSIEASRIWDSQGLGISELKACFDMYVTEGLREHEGNLEIIYTIGNVLRAMIKRFSNQNYPINRSDRVDWKRALIERMILAIRGDLSKDWSVDKLALLCNVSSSYLHKLTKQSMGISPIGIVRREKLERGKFLLEHSDYPMKVVSERLGYSSIFAFSKAFKKKFGVSPKNIVF